MRGRTIRDTDPLPVVPTPLHVGAALAAMLFSSLAFGQAHMDVAGAAQAVAMTALEGTSSVRARIMVLGTFHFAGSETDERRSGSAGMLSPERQRQIAEVVERLERFAPTRIVLEVKADQRELVNTQYAAYLRDAFVLGENEIYQLGFRTARALGHREVFAADVEGRWFEPYLDPQAWAEAHDQTAWLEDAGAGGFQRAMELLGTHRQWPLAKYLALLNTPEVLSLFRAEYLHQKLALGDDEVYPGADGFVSQWYNRHLRLYGNLLRLRRDADERILLVIGNAHAAMLRRLLEDSLHFEPVSPVPFLVQDATADVQGLEGALRGNTYAIERAGGRLSGPGFELLCDAAEPAMFFLIGEPHNVRQVPELTLALFDALAERYGFDRIGVEQGPLVVERMQAAARAEGLEAVRAMARREPAALHFQGDAELAFVASAAGRAGGQGALYGLDRILGFDHVLDWLGASPDGDRLAECIASFRDEARAAVPAVAGGSLVELHPEAVVEFARRVAELARDTRVREIADRWEQSVENLCRFRDGDRLQGTTQRERMSKAALRRRVEEHERAGGAVPRVLLRFGHQHMRRSGSQGDTSPLGAEAVAIATEHGLETFHLAIQLINRPGEWWSLGDYPEYAPLAAVGDPDRWLVVDLRPVRARIVEDDAASEELRELARDFDAVLLLGGGTRDTTSWR